jgi:hypothetical protein
MPDETSLETRVTDAAAACAEEIATQEGWHNDSDLTSLRQLLARHMRELLGVADPSSQRSDAIPHLDLSQQEMADEVCVPSSGESPTAEADRLRQVMARINDTICQTLAQALGGYMWFKDDQVNFPGATEANGVLVVEQTAEDLAKLAAKRIAMQAARITALESIGPLLDDFQAACAAAGRFGDSEYRYDVRQLRARINALLAGSHAQEQTADAPC